MLTSSLAELLTEVSLPDHASRRLVFCDEGFTEMMRWRGLADDLNSSTCLVFPLHEHMSTYEQDSVRLFQPDEAVFLVSAPLKQAYSFIIRAANACREEGRSSADPRLVVLTTTTEAAMASGDDKGPGYKELALLLSPRNPEAVRVLYFPVHSFPITPSSVSGQQQQPAVDAFVLSSHVCRAFFPLSLSGLGLWKHSADSGRDTPQPCIHDIDVQDISADKRGQMRVLAHELAGSLVFGHNLDCLSHMFTIGKTADFIGHTMQPVLERLLQQRATALDVEGQKGQKAQERHAGIRAALQLSERGVLLYGQHLTPDGDGRSAEKASLLLIDRVCDLVTPAVHTATAPLAHRIVNTLRRQVEALTGAAGGGGLHERNVHLCDLQPGAPSHTVGGIAASLLDVRSPFAQTTTSSSGGEAAACEELCGALRGLAKEAGLDAAAASPLGRTIADAEQLLQQIMQHVGDKSSLAGASFRLRHAPLLGLAAGAVCAFRSPAEDKTREVLGFRVPFEVRSAREHALLQLLCVPGAGLAEAIPFITSFLTPSPRSADPCVGDACVLHTLSLLMISISLVGCGGSEDEGDANGDSRAVLQSLSLATSAVVERVIALHDNASVVDSGELALLVRLQLVPPHTSSLSEITHFIEGVMDRFLEHALDNHARASSVLGDASSDAAAACSGTFARAARKQLRANSIGSVGRSVSRTVNRLTGKTDIIGLLARMVGVVIDTACNVDGLGDSKHRGSSERQLMLPLDMLLHVEAPMDKIKRAGLKFLSKGLSLWGSGGGSAVVQGSGRSVNANGLPHPADYDTLVVFVIGGISYRELGQVREQLELYYGCGGATGGSTYAKKRLKVIVGSTSTLSVDNLLELFIHA
mgnify:CR=1 FL=1